MQEMQDAQVADAEDPRAPTPNTMQLAEDCSGARCAPVPPARPGSGEAQLGYPRNKYLRFS